MYTFRNEDYDLIFADGTVWIQATPSRGQFQMWVLENGMVDSHHPRLTEVTKLVSDKTIIVLAKTGSNIKDKVEKLCSAKGYLAQFLKEDGPIDLAFTVRSAYDE